MDIPLWLWAAIVVAATFVLYVRLFRPWQLAWGASAEEVARALPGDVFGLPLAVLAYRRNLESAIACHWTIDAVRFAVGL